MKIRIERLLLILVLILAISGNVSASAYRSQTIYYSQTKLPKSVLPQNQQKANAYVDGFKDFFGTPTSSGVSNTASIFTSNYVNHQNALNDKYVASANKNMEQWLSYRKGGNQFRDNMIKDMDAASAARNKALGATVLSKAYGVYGVYSDISTYNNKSNHNHSSLAFIDQTLRGFSIIAGSMDTVGFKPAAPLAVGGGLAKDAFGGKAFSDWANKQDNIALDYFDWVTDNVNDGTTYAFGFYMDLFNKGKNSNLNGRPPFGANVYKPNIYLYPEKDTLIHISFDYPALLTTTIPDYAKQWSVMASADGMLKDVSDEAGYDFLFYESETEPALFLYDTGWLISAETRTKQFRHILNAYGFTEKEADDFVNFWDDKLLSDTDYVMYPQQTEMVDNAMPITVTPQPDSCCRIWFAFRCWQGQHPDTPVIKPIKRTGFTLVEWGGFLLE